MTAAVGSEVARPRPGDRVRALDKESVPAGHCGGGPGRVRTASRASAPFCGRRGGAVLQGAEVPSHPASWEPNSALVLIEAGHEVPSSGTACPLSQMAPKTPGSKANAKSRGEGSGGWGDAHTSC